MKKILNGDYVCGLLRMASVEIAPSFVDAFCLDNNSFINDFKKFYNYKLDIKVQSIDSNIDVFFKNVLNMNEKHVKSLLYWLECKYGKIESILEPTNNDIIDFLSGCNDGYSGFYFLENLYFIKFQKVVVCLLIGNNE